MKNKLLLLSLLMGLKFVYAQDDTSESSQSAEVSSEEGDLLTDEAASGDQLAPTNPAVLQDEPELSESEQQSADALTGEDNTSTSLQTEKSANTDSNASVDMPSEDEAFEDIPAENSQAQSEAPPAVIAPNAPPATANSDEGIPQDILELERSFESGQAGNEKKDLLVSEPDKGGASGKSFDLAPDPGSDLPPSEKFARVPLRPQMSDRSWSRFAGAQIEKIYKVKRGDSLWVISERLFGNPHLWPKVWQLNAGLGNAHVLEAGHELLFTPGNPNAAPFLAFRQIPGKNDAYLPSLLGHHKGDDLSAKINSALTDADKGFTRFRSFLLKNNPEKVGEIPMQGNRIGNKIVLSKGDRFYLPKVAPGEYAVVRTKDSPQKGLKAKVLWWVGTIRVSESNGDKAYNAEITQSFEAIYPKDEIVVRSFALAPLALHTEVLGDDRKDEVSFVNIDSSLITLSAEDHLIGARFKNEAAGPSLGGLVNVYRDKDWVASAVLIDRDEDVGTFWVVDSKGEVLPTDRVE